MVSHVIALFSDNFVFFQILTIETVHSIGLNVMIFIVIPNLDPISGLLLTLCTGVIPSFLKVCREILMALWVQRSWVRITFNGEISSQT